jgi:hypothetical protein
MSEFGGFALLVLRTFYIVGYFMNNRMLFAKFMRTMYLLKDENSPCGMQNVRFTLMDCFNDFKDIFCVCCRKIKPRE